MAIQTTFSGNVKRYDGTSEKYNHRFSAETTEAEGVTGRIVLATASRDISLFPIGLIKATSVFIETDSKVRVSCYGDVDASLDVLADGIFAINGSISDVRLYNKSATNVVTINYLITG